MILSQEKAEKRLKKGADFYIAYWTGWEKRGWAA
jgi:hypothetical protein